MARAQPEKTLVEFAVQCLSGEPNGVVFLNAEISVASLLAQHGLSLNIICEQVERGAFMQLQQGGFDVRPRLDYDEGSFDGCLILTSKYRIENEWMVARAQRIVRPGGIILIAGAKNTGIASLKKKLKSKFQIDASYVKYHSQAFAIVNPLSSEPCETEDLLNEIVGDGRIYHTQPGVFSAEKIDPGSHLLATCFVGHKGGKIADLGAGWGYLSSQAADRFSAPTSLDLFESNWHALQCARANTQAAAGRIPTRYNWHDVQLEDIGEHFDTVIMNPPFHQGKNTSLDLGQHFLHVAARITREGGELFLVANRQLAYEKILRQLYTSIRKMEENSIYKIIHAIR